MQQQRVGGGASGGGWIDFLVFVNEFLALASQIHKKPVLLVKTSG